MTFALVAILSAFILNVRQNHHREIADAVQAKLESVDELFEKQLHSDIKLLSATIEMAVAENPRIQAAWLAKDRKKLLKLTAPLLEEWRNKYQITHFYFHDINRVNFLRVYDPENHGGSINRFTILKAEKSGQTSAGIELGRLETFTLRVVHPWRINNQLVGYIELGEEVENIIQKIRNILNVELYLSMYKSNLNRERWEKGMELLGRKGNWDLLNGAVIVSQTLQEVPEVFKDFFVERKHHYMEINPDIKLKMGEKFYRIGVIPLSDAANQEVGDILVLHNVAPQITHARNSVVMISVICAVVGVILFILFFIVLDRVEQKLQSTHLKLIKARDELEVKVKSRTSDLAKTNKELQSEINERKQTGEELRQSEARFRSIFEDSPIGIATVDKNLKFLKVNKAFCEMLGYREEELANLTISDITHPEDLEKSITLSTSLVSGKTTGYNLEKRYVRKDGQIFWGRLTTSIVHNPKSKSLYAIGMVVDITERKTAEEKINLAYQTTRDILKKAPFGIYVIASDGCVEYVNPAMLKIAGDNYEQFKELNIFDLPTYQKMGITEKIKTGLKGEYFKIEAAETFRNFIGIPLEEEGKRKVLMIVEDITNHIQMEQKLQKAYEEMETMVEKRTIDLEKTNEELHAEIAERKKAEEELHRRHYIQTILNKMLHISLRPYSLEKILDDILKQIVSISWITLEKMGGIFLVEDKTDVLIMKSSYMFPEDLRSHCAEVPFGSCFCGQAALTKKIQFVTASHKRHKFSSKVIPTHGHYCIPIISANKTLGTLVLYVKKGYQRNKEEEDFLQLIANVLAGIIERKRVEEELHKSSEELRNLSAHLRSIREEERTAIAREIHDELGQILTALQMDLSNLTLELPESKTRLINKKTKSMSELIDTSIQAVRRISSNLRPSILDDLGIVSAIEWHAEEFQSRMGIKCSVDCSVDDILLDKEHSTVIFRIFQETLTNIARHARATAIEASLEQEDSRVILEIKDNGKGITKKEASSPTSFGIIGMKERVHFLGGKINIEGIEGKGTTVTVSIPMSEEEEYL
jgi:PAS domain S-box-containing protein